MPFPRRAVDRSRAPTSSVGPGAAFAGVTALGVARFARRGRSRPGRAEPAAHGRVRRGRRSTRRRSRAAGLTGELRAVRAHRARPRARASRRAQADARRRGRARSRARLRRGDTQPRRRSRTRPAGWRTSPSSAYNGQATGVSPKAFVAAARSSRSRRATRPGSAASSGAARRRTRPTRPLKRRRGPRRPARAGGAADDPARHRRRWTATARSPRPRPASPARASSASARSPAPALPRGAPRRAPPGSAPAIAPCSTTRSRWSTCRPRSTPRPSAPRRSRAGPREAAQVVGAVERAHVKAFRALLGSEGDQAPRFDFQGVTEDQKPFLKTAVAFEDLAVAAYKGQARG